MILGSDVVAIAQGDWHPANSSRAYASVLEAKDGVLAVRNQVDGDTTVHTSSLISAVEITARVGSIPRRLSFPDGSLFETPDNDAVDRYLAENGGERSGLVHRLEEFHPRLIAFTLAVILMAAVIYRYALPALVELAVLVTPPFVPVLMASGTMETLDRTVFKPSALPEADRTAIAADFARVAAASSGGAARYTLNFREGGYIGPNAFALPDGTLVITDELITLAGGDRQMIIGVLAHEIGHVELEHSLRQLYRAAGVAGLIMLIAGDVGDSIEDILTQGGGLLALSYSRSSESEADRRSVELMRKAGMDPTAIARFFELMEKKLGDHSGTSILSTHPGTPERKQAILDYDALLKQQGAN